MGEYQPLDPLTEVFLSETEEQLKELRELIRGARREGGISKDRYGAIFRIAHTIKGSAAMMSLDGLRSLAHRMEDFFLYMQAEPEGEAALEPVAGMIEACLRRIEWELRQLRTGEAAGPCGGVSFLSAIFEGMGRIAQGIGEALGKEVRLRGIGGEIEVDHALLAHLLPPLIHLVRNCVVHSVETPLERLATNKPACATITLQAQISKERLHLCVADDGRGLDGEKIRESALRRGLLPVDHGEISEEEMVRLIFMPGFSTREMTTEFSGRGIGLDAVRQSVLSLGGTIQVSSSPGQGMTVRMDFSLKSEEE